MQTAKLIRTTHLLFKCYSYRGVHASMCDLLAAAFEAAEEEAATVQEGAATN